MHFRLFRWLCGYFISSKGFLPTVIDIMVIWVDHWFLKCRCSLLPSPVWPLPICLYSWTQHSRFLCNIALFIASDFTSITSHIHSWVVLLLWLHLFILSGVISPLISSSILGTYRPGEFLFQCPIFLPFHTVRGVLKARILKWFVIPFSCGLHFVRALHYDLSILGGSTWHGLWFHWVRQDCGPCDQIG